MILEPRWEEHIDLPISWLCIKNSLADAITQKMREERYKDLIDDSITQSINFLIKLGIIKEVNTRNEVIKALKGKELVLWDKAIPIPSYCNLIISPKLGTMLIKHHFPKIWENMSKGQIYSHYGLTTIKECVAYTLEYLQKENLLKEETEILDKLR